jgi:hypothetical protein
MSIMETKTLNVRILFAPVPSPTLLSLQVDKLLGRILEIKLLDGSRQFAECPLGVVVVVVVIISFVIIR